MAKKIGYMFVDGNLTLVLAGHAYDVGKHHPKYKEIVLLMARPTGETEEQEADRCARLEALVNAEDEFKATTENQLGAPVEIKHGVVYVDGEPLHNNLTKRILELREAGLPFTAFVNFLANLRLNPSAESRAALYDFLEQGRFPLTEDGCFLGYKGVYRGTLTRKDGTKYETLVDGHTRSLDMAPGNYHEMPWDEVDDNRNSACGSGYHVGTIGHARGFGDTMIVVKTNPKDVVSVPLYDKTKLRACAYLSVNIYEDQKTAKEFIKPVYSEEEYTSETFEEKEEEHLTSLQPSAEALREKYNKLTRDDACREASAQGIFFSTNEARWLGKELVVEALVLGDLPYDAMSRQQLAELCVRRHLFSSVRSALKSGRDDMVAGLRLSYGLEDADATE